MVTTPSGIGQNIRFFKKDAEIVMDAKTGEEFVLFQCKNIKKIRPNWIQSIQI